MSELLFSLSISLAVFGGVAYSLTQLLKPFLPVPWRKKTRIGKAAMVAMPVLIGGVLGAFAMDSLVDYLSAMLGGSGEISLPFVASCVLGLFSGSFATQIHSVVRQRILAKAKEDEPSAV